MTRIDFYQTSGDEHAFACRLIDMVYRKGHQIYVHTSAEEQAKTLNEQLWTFKEDSFVPHSLHSEAMDVPIKIGFDHEPEEHQDVLINLSGQIPHFFSRFDRVAEIVPVDQNSRKSARENYAYYKERGYVLNYHEIS
ncbi:MAG: DNA polymerase III subunit chi [Gammaproteobacteria bacterium]|nr:DNA polymerase III subunit chi [Gammaproteobacteria bacterium]MBT4379699.1 DNA polymerase III subunit chi [Gammaproteobacteria bacterium]MBT4618024.1 DNA polymerase III subunit chi [Gammaproteobacteria bacterium]MBT5198666.1 DNA polymerase III subunit chi [Gammaproteobacteria bacterium]MBT5443967.1 DNA polymerase III subunit chi [Gammaproteobacteria bacterium]